MVSNGVGRLWTLLTGERGEYEVAAGNLTSARKRLDTMAGFANDGLMIPEQVWDLKRVRTGFRFGAGTGSATPLAWSMAQFIRLAMNIREGKESGNTRKSCWERYVGFCAVAQRRKGPKMKSTLGSISDDYSTILDLCCRSRRHAPSRRYGRSEGKNSISLQAEHAAGKGCERDSRCDRRCGSRVRAENRRR